MLKKYCMLRKHSLQMMTEGHRGELLVLESDWKSFQVDGPTAAKLRGLKRTVLVAKTTRSQRTAEPRAQITTAGVLQNWLTNGDQVTQCDAVQTVKHQDTQPVGNAFTYWQPVQNITKRVRNATKFSISDDQSCRSIENSLELSQMNVVCTSDISVSISVFISISGFIMLKMKSIALMLLLQGVTK